MADELGKHKILIVDDDSEWCTTISETARLLGHDPDSTNSLDEAYEKIEAAHKAAAPYSMAIVDMKYPIGKKEIEVARGKDAIRHIKKNYPYIACIMITGEPMTPAEVLDLRDDYGLDYYIQKDTFGIDTLSRAIERSGKRTSGKGNSQQERLALLDDTIEKWKNIRFNYRKNLALAKERESQKGIDLDVQTMHEIERYERELREAEEQVKALEDEKRRSSND